MPKLIPVPDEVSQPYWDAVNSRKLVLQYCSDCAKLQYPINKTCYHCNGSESLEWKEVEGKGEIIAAIVIEDGRLNRSCLLYTSPSPRDLSTSRMPSSA